MITLRVRPLDLAVKLACDQASMGPDRGRLVGASVILPDIGKPFVSGLAFLRYGGEKSFVKPEATDEELSLPEGLTIHL